MGRPWSIFTLLAVSELAADDGGPTRFLISEAIVMNACSTLVAFFADVSKNGMFNWSANSYNDVHYIFVWNSCCYLRNWRKVVWLSGNNDEVNKFEYAMTHFQCFQKKQFDNMTRRCLLHITHGKRTFPVRYETIMNRNGVKFWIKWYLRDRIVVSNYC